MPARAESLAAMPTTSYCANCAKVQPLLRAYFWEALGEFCGTCGGCRSDIVVRTEAV